MLSIDDNGLIIKDGTRLLIPEGMRTRWIDYLQNLHSSPEKVIERARKSIWWPFINSDLKQRRRTCETCVERSPSNPSDQIKPHEPAIYPFQRIHADLGNYGGKQWIIITDQFSGWPLMRNLGKEALSRDVIKSFMMVFADYGIPETIVTDGGPQFKSKEFEELCGKFMINHEMSSPHHPQSNGHAENAVKQMKRLIHCTFDPQLGTVNLEKCTKALLLFRNTPRRPSGLSPAEILFGRVLRDGVPTKLDQYLPQHREAVLRRQEAVESYRRQMEKIENVRRFRKGDRVAVQDPVSKRWNLRAIVIDEPKFRNYIVETEEGGRYRRNQKFLKLLPNPNPVTDVEPPKAVPRSTIEPEVEPGLPRRSARERAPPKRFDDECAAAEVERRVEYDRKERKTVRFCDGPPKCSFSGQQNQLKK